MNNSPEDRLRALKNRQIIADWNAPSPNHGLAGGLLPWVIMPISEGPASLYHSERDLVLAIEVLEKFGPINFAPDRQAA